MRMLVWESLVRHRYCQSEVLVAVLPADDEVCGCRSRCPASGIRPRRHWSCQETPMFRGHDEFASCCGMAPSDSRSGAGVIPTSSRRGGNGQLKNLQIFSRNPLVATPSRFGGNYDEWMGSG